MNQPQQTPVSPSQGGMPQGGQQMEPPKQGVATWLWIVLVIIILAAIGYFGWMYFGPGKTSTSTTSTTTPVTTPVTTSKTTTPTTTTTTPTNDATTPTTSPTTVTTPPTGWKVMSVALKEKGDSITYTISVFGKTDWISPGTGSTTNYQNKLTKPGIADSTEAGVNDYYVRFNICTTTVFPSGCPTDPNAAKSIKTSDDRGLVYVNFDGISLNDADKKIILDSISISKP